MLPHIRRIEQKMRQTLLNSKVSGQTRSLSEENVVPNMPRSDDDDDDESDDESMTSYTSGAISRSHIAAHYPRDSTFSMQVDRPMGLNNSAYPHHSYSNPSENGDPNKPPPVSTSSRGLTIRTIEGNLTVYDNTVHQTNISSHNVKGNKVINSFNPKCLCRFCFWIPSN